MNAISALLRRDAREMMCVSHYPVGMLQEGNPLQNRRGRTTDQVSWCLPVGLSSLQNCEEAVSVAESHLVGAPGGSVR